MRTVTIGQFLTEAEIVQASQLWRKLPVGVSFAQAVCEEVIRPNLERINKALGQENDPMYLAYTVEYAVGSALNRPLPSGKDVLHAACCYGVTDVPAQEWPADADPHTEPEWGYS